ncbi:hypothetical protein Peur_008005 [Populus x canadensis]
MFFIALKMKLRGGHILFPWCSFSCFASKISFPCDPSFRIVGLILLAVETESPS